MLRYVIQPRPQPHRSHQEGPLSSRQTVHSTDSPTALPARHRPVVRPAPVVLTWLALVSYFSLVSIYLFRLFTLVCVNVLLHIVFGRIIHSSSFTHPYCRLLITKKVSLFFRAHFISILHLFLSSFFFSLIYLFSLYGRKM